MAATEVKSKKRKVAAEQSPKPKKQKKTDEPAQATRKSTRTKKEVVEVVESPPVAVKTARKRAEDFFSDNEAAPDAAAPKPKKAKKTKVAVTEEVKEVEEVKAEKPKKKTKKGKEPVAEVAVEEAAAEEVVSDKKSKKSKKSKTQENDEPLLEFREVDVLENDEEDEEDLDDQTAALLAGFESDRDESDAENDGDVAVDEGALAIPKLSKKQQKALEKAKKDTEPGVVFLGRIPHGFYEREMKGYFSQFGDISRLRLSRNKKTGASKHYAFIEFTHGSVAEVAAKTMHNYILFNHILQCKVVPPEQVHPDLFKGANQRFKVDPRNKKAGSALARGATRPEWEKRIKKEKQRRAKQAGSLKEEFDYEFEAPAVKPVESVPVKSIDTSAAAEQQLQIEAPAQQVSEVVQVVESTPDQITVTETVKVKKPKKSATKAAAEPVANGVAEAATEAAPAPKAKKDKKRKSTGSIAAGEEPVDAPGSATKKAKKAKKAKA